MTQACIPAAAQGEPAMDASEACNTRKTIQRSSRGVRRRMEILAGYMEWILTPAETNGRYCMLESYSAWCRGSAASASGSRGVLHRGRDTGGRPPWLGRAGVVPVTAGDSMRHDHQRGSRCVALELRANQTQNKRPASELIAVRYPAFAVQCKSRAFRKPTLTQERQ